ncbi:MAG TPA: hypothetical protein VIH35_07570 [Kiritimatiellia bacterium]|jgi:hypothetical protein
MKAKHMTVVAGMAAVVGLAAGDGAFALDLSSNLVVNAGFEAIGPSTNRAARWEPFTSGGLAPALKTGAAKSGTNSLQLIAQGKPRSFQGVTQILDVQPGERYDMSAFVHKVSENPLKGGAYGQLVIEWLDAEGKEIERVWGPAWGKNLSRVRWEKVSIERAQAPPLAVRAVFGVHLYDGKGAASGSVLVDDIAVTSPSMTAQERRKSRMVGIGQPSLRP